MGIGRKLIIASVVAGLQVLASAQTSGQQSTPVDSSVDGGVRTAPAAALSNAVQIGGDAGDSSSILPRIPAVLGGPTVSSSFTSESEKSNYLRGGVNIGAAYDDNPLLLSTGAGSNTSETIFPNIRLEESSSRMRLSLGYAGGFTINQKFTNENQGSHSLLFESQYRLSPHVDLRVAENFSMTTGFFDAGNGTAMVPGSGVPTASLITPFSTQTASTTTVEANYHFALYDLVGASGSFNDLHFSNVQAGTQLTNSETASASAFWLHRLSRGNWGGLIYRFDRITFTSGNGETRVHSFYALDTLNVSSHFSLTAFVGPQYSDNQGAVAGTILSTEFSNWWVAGGIEAAWANEHTSVAGGYSRTTSDGGGLLGVTRLQDVHGVVRQKLARDWAIAFTGIYGTNRSITVPSIESASSIDLTSGGISLEHNVGKSLGLRMGYTHAFQQEFGVVAPGQGAPSTRDAHDNRVFVTLSYQWSKPLGM
jgi:hypothetical protein